MSSWQEVSNYFTNNYKISKNEPGHLVLFFGLDGLRSQAVHIFRQTLNGGTEEWIQLESPFGKLGDGDINAVLRAVGDIVCGGIATVGELLVVRHSVPLLNVDINEIQRPLLLVTSTADQLEKLYTGRDDF